MPILLSFNYLFFHTASTRWLIGFAFELLCTPLMSSSFRWKQPVCARLRCMTTFYFCRYFCAKCMEHNSSMANQPYVLASLPLGFGTILQSYYNASTLKQCFCKQEWIVIVGNYVFVLYKHNLRGDLMMFAMCILSVILFFI